MADERTACRWVLEGTWGELAYGWRRAEVWMEHPIDTRVRVVAVPTDHEPPRMMQSIWPSRVGESTYVIDDEPTDHEDQP